ncbi:M48 family metalloprotease [Allopontixanthobacter sediminis]|uniref:M48 family metalloprotease n=1 Tax=Allopontixanthobacter sediminis TaxID=1689985 RepID=A0A845B322_9SPHN|nr:M48 family metalloprotease [Allopontixanthobacter sediminis]MXP43827.1 M48 family metalloprotease [Allopontixanthobacter sediminis]
MPNFKQTAFISTAIASLALSGCTAMGGGAIPSTSAPITSNEAQQGAEAHPQFLQEFGGSYQGPQAAYVEQVGKNIAVQSGLGNARESFTVTLLNSSVNNAFAIPGGYVYATRQLVGLMNNEAELAGVLGHEVGHVAARHSQRRQSTAQQNSIIGAAGAILSGILLGDSGLGETVSRGFLQGSQLLTLKFSRSQELQADELGIQYLNKAGYDPRAMATVLQSLAAQNALDSSLQGNNASVPEWASTHPDPASRVQSAFAKAGQASGTTNRDTFLTRIDGMMYGDDPSQGVIEGRQYLHPEFRLAFTAPSGFYMVNGSRAVSINGESGSGQLSTAPYSGNLDSYVRTAFSALAGSGQALAPASMQRNTVNGIPAMYGTARVTSGGSQVDVTVFAYEFSRSQAFHFATIAPAGRAATFTPMYNSMRRISASEAAAVVPRRIDVITVRPGDTVRTLANRMAYTTAQEQRLRVLNGLGSSDVVTAGQKVKLVVK